MSDEEKNPADSPSESGRNVRTFEMVNLPKGDIPFADFLSDSARGNVSPPVVLALAKELASQTDNRLLTTCLLRGTPDVTRAPVDSRAIGKGRTPEDIRRYVDLIQTLSPEEAKTVTLRFDNAAREYPATEGSEKLRTALFEYLETVYGMPKGMDLIIGPGGRPLLDQVVRLFDDDVVFIHPEIAYSALLGILRDHGKNVKQFRLILKIFPWRFFFVMSRKK